MTLRENTKLTQIRRTGVLTEGDGNSRGGTERGGRNEGRDYMTVNEIEATRRGGGGREKARSREGDMKSLRQAGRKTEGGAEERNEREQRVKRL